MDDEPREPDQRNYISCLTWVRKGVAASTPDKVRFLETFYFIDFLQFDVNNYKNLKIQ